MTVLKMPKLKQEMDGIWKKLTLKPKSKLRKRQLYSERNFYILLYMFFNQYDKLAASLGLKYAPHFLSFPPTQNMNDKIIFKHFVCYRYLLGYVLYFFPYLFRKIAMTYWIMKSSNWCRYHQHHRKTVMLPPYWYPLKILMMMTTTKRKETIMVFWTRKNRGAINANDITRKRQRFCYTDIN